MNNVKQYTSWGEHVKVITKDGNIYVDVLLCPDPFDPYSRKHILEYRNGDTLLVETKNLKGFTRPGNDLFYKFS